VAAVAMAWKGTERLMDTIRHYANFPATGVSLRQMVQFGEKPSVGKFWNVSAIAYSDLMLISCAGLFQVHCSAPRSSCPRSYPYGSRIAYKSLTAYLTD
jgi:hypothetical protein